jgi:hypothetical protein
MVHETADNLRWKSIGFRLARSQIPMIYGNAVRGPHAKNAKSNPTTAGTPEQDKPQEEVQEADRTGASPLESSKIRGGRQSAIHFVFVQRSICEPLQS